MNDKWNEHVERAKRIFSEGVKMTKADKHYRRHHLGNIKEWLSLSETPLRAAQGATAEALKAHWEADDCEGMVTTTDIAQAVNTALMWATHAMDMVRMSLEDLADNSEPNPLPETVTPGQYTCADCGATFDEPWLEDDNPGCLHCGSWDFDVTIPF